MKDQVDHLNQLGIPAAYINSTLSFKEMQQHLRDASRGAYKLVYIAPERLESPRFQSLLREVPSLWSPSMRPTASPSGDMTSGPVTGPLPTGSENCPTDR